MTDRLVVAAALVDDLVRPRRLLGARRTAPPHLAGRWELPGGKVEPGEQPVAALRRELREELGVGIRLGEALPGPGAGTWPLGPGLRLALWWAVPVGDPRLLQDHDQLRWLAPDELDSVPWLASNEEVLAHVVRAWPAG